MDNRQLIKLNVSGKVQGVWFRQSTKLFALQHAISGYAKNLPDGSVEVVAVGLAKDIEALTVYLHQGPELARVDAVLVQWTGELSAAPELDDINLDDFETR